MRERERETEREKEAKTQKNREREMIGGCNTCIYWRKGEKLRKNTEKPHRDC